MSRELYDKTLNMLTAYALQDDPRKAGMAVKRWARQNKDQAQCAMLKELIRKILARPNDKAGSIVAHVEKQMKEQNLLMK